MRTLAGRIVCVAVALWVMVGSAAFAQAPKDEAREQSIYIPYKKLREVFEKEGRVVFMPYEKFLDLWKDRVERTPVPVPSRPPVDWIISEVTNVASVSKDVVTVSASVKIELLKDGWNEVSLGLRDVALTKATLDGAPARIVFAPGAGYRLLVERKPAQPQPLTLNLEFAKAFTRAPGQNSVSFETPQAPVSRWEVRIAEPGVKVNIQPLLAATEVPPAPKVEETVVLAFVGAAPTVRIDWTPKAEGARGLTALASVNVEQALEIEEGVVRTRATLAYSISRAELTSLIVEVPADQKVVNVFDPNVREWTVEPPVGGMQKIQVQLFEPAKSAQNLVVELQRFVTDQAGAQEIGAPVIRASGVSRQQGVVVVRVADTLRSEATRRAGLMQVDAADLPAALAGPRWQYSYRYAALPFDLALSVEKIQPEIEADVLVEAHLQPEELTLDVLAVFNVQRAGVFRLDLNVPQGYDVRLVRGNSVAGVTSAAVDTHHLEGADNTLLAVNLSRKALGKVGIEVQLYKRLKEPDLLSPTGKSATVAIGVPRVTGTNLKHQTGRVVVYAPESLRVNVTDVKGLRNISAAEATAGMRSTMTGAERPVVAFAGGDEAVALTLAGERRKPQVTARQFLVARVEPGVVTYDVALFYQVLYSGVKSVRLDVPADLASDIRITTPGIRYQAFDESEKPQDLADKYIAWKLTGETEFLGEVKIALRWEKKLEKLDVGQSVKLDIPRLKPMAVDRAMGQIVLVKAETIDVRPEKASESLRPIDPQHDLMAGAAVTGAAARAFEFHDDWDLSVVATQFRLQEVKATSIERAFVRMVYTRAKVTSVQAVYRMRSQEQRLHVRLPAGATFDTEPLRINGRAVTLEQSDPRKGVYAIPLVGQSSDQAFVLELRYSVPHAGMTFECPDFGEESPDAAAQPAVQKVHLGVYLPQELAYLGSRGPWTDELTWVMRGFSVRPRGSTPDENVLSDVIQGVDVDLQRLQSFERDGRYYLFSTLRPLPAPKGALRVTVLHEGWLSAIILVVVLGAGAVLVRSCWTVKAFAAGAFITLLVLIAIFLPTFARVITGGALYGSAFIVAVAWALYWLVTFLARRAAEGPRIVTPPPVAQPIPPQQDPSAGKEA